VGFRGKVEDRVDLVLLEQTKHEGGIIYVTLDKGAVLFDHGVKVFDIGAVGELVKHDDMVVRVFLTEVDHEVGPDEPSSSSHE